MHRPGRVGYFASWQAASQAGALLLGALAAATISAVVSGEQLNAWGWRVPFYASAVIVPLGLYIRRRVDDPEAFVRQDRPAASPVSLLWRSHWAAVARGFGITIIWTVATYFFFVYVPLYAHTVLKLPMSITLFSNSIALALLLAIAPVAGHLSDRFGRLSLMIAAVLAIVLLIHPGFGFLLRHPHASALAAFQSIGRSGSAVYRSGAGRNRRIISSRCSFLGMGIAYNLAVTLFGGFAPSIATSLIARTGNPLAPTWYVMFSCGLKLAALLFTLRTSSRGP